MAKVRDRVVVFAELLEKAQDLVGGQPQIIYVDQPDLDGWGPMGEISPR